MARLNAFVLVALLGMVVCAHAAEAEYAHGRDLKQGWPLPRVSYDTPSGKVKVAPYRLSVQNLVAGNVFFPNVYLTGRGGRKLMQGWPLPRVSYDTPVGKVKVAPYRLSVQNLVAGNIFSPNVYLTGRGGKKL